MVFASYFFKQVQSLRLSSLFFGLGFLFPSISFGSTKLRLNVQREIANCAESVVSTILREKYQDPSLNEQKLLSSFSQESIDPTFVRPLNTVGNVFKVRDLQGHYYVVRIENKVLDNLQREHFATEFARRVPGIAVPATRVISGTNSKWILNLYRKRLPDDFKEMLDTTLQTTNINNIQISVTTLVPGKDGQAFLNPLHICDNICGIVEVLARPNADLNESRFRLLQRQLDFLLVMAEEDRREIFIDDVRSLYPPLQQMERDKVLPHLLNNLREIRGTKLQWISLPGIKRMKRSSLRQIASLWVVYTILGIPDFKNNNWIKSGKTIVGIDLAHPGSRGLKKNPFLLEWQMNPFGQTQLHSRIVNLLLRSTSPELKEYFRKITPDYVRSLAQKTNYPLSHEELAEIMKRIEFFNTQGT